MYAEWSSAENRPLFPGTCSEQGKVQVKLMTKKKMTAVFYLGEPVPELWSSIVQAHSLTWLTT